MPDFFQVVEKGTLSSQVGYFFLLDDAHPLVRHAVGHVGVVVHAVGYELALRGQGKLVEELLGGQDAFLQAAVLPDFEGAGGHGGGGPAIGGVRLVDVDQEEIRHVGELFNQPPEKGQLANEGGSGGRAEVDHQGAVGRFEVEEAALVFGVAGGAAASGAQTVDLHDLGVGRLAAELDLFVGIQEKAVPYGAHAG